jgi:hypothetical protein
VLVVEQPDRVAIRPAEGLDPGAVGEVGVHPGQPFRLGETGDDLVVRVRLPDAQRHVGYLADRQAVVPAVHAVGQDLPGHGEPRRADGGRVHGPRVVFGQWYRHARSLRTSRAAVRQKPLA